jgi:hypothetical protein
VQGGRVNKPAAREINDAPRDDLAITLVTSEYLQVGAR